MSEQKRSQNPLYVVTNKGSVVEEAEGLFDLLVKKFNLNPALETLNQVYEIFMQMLLSYVTSYPLLVEANKLLARAIYEFELLLAKLGLGPVVEKKF